MFLGSILPSQSQDVDSEAADDEDIDDVVMDTVDAGGEI
jgi:hypothetical protein